MITPVLGNELLMFNSVNKPPPVRSVAAQNSVFFLVVEGLIMPKNGDATRQGGVSSERN
jgi:hypothetical protein